MKNNYWKDACLLLVGLIIGYRINMYNHPIIKEHTITNVRDSVKVDTLIVQIKKIPSLNKSNVLAELKKQNVPHPHVVLKQSILETGHYTSKVCKTHNNIFGIRRGNKYVAYNSWVDCVADYKKKISKRYKGGDYYEFLKNLGYAEDELYISKLKGIS